MLKFLDVEHGITTLMHHNVIPFIHYVLLTGFSSVLKSVMFVINK